MELFRREALDGQDRLHGDVVFIPQVSWRMLGAFFLAALALAALYLSLAQYRPATHVSGRLAAAEGSLIASFEVRTTAADGLASGRPLRLTFPGTARTLDARVTALHPSADGVTMVQARVDDAHGLGSGMAVSTLLPAPPRSLAAALYDDLSGTERR